jgi:hypothetical protein
MKNTIEEILGVKSLSGDREIPGTHTVEGREYCYFECADENCELIFQRLVRAITPAIPTDGGAITGGCELTLPDGRKFHAMSYKGDLLGWRMQIERGAEYLEIVTAKLVEDNLVVTNSEEIPLAICKPRFY